MTIVNLLAQIGTSDALQIYQDYQGLIDNFDFAKFSKSATNYDITELNNINQKLLQVIDYPQVLSRLNNNQSKITEKFFNVFKGNITFIDELNHWLELCYQPFRYANQVKDQEFLKQIINYLPADTTNENAWQIWLDTIKKNTDRTGKNLFMPIRLALTGQESGVELKHLVNFIARDEIINRLSSIDE